MKVRLDLMETHPFREAERPYEWTCAGCGKPRALHLDNGFPKGTILSGIYSTLTMDIKARYGCHPQFKKPRPWTAKDEDEWKKEYSDTKAAIKRRRKAGIS